MAIFKRFNGKKLKSSADPNWKRAKWWMRKQVGGVLIHQALPYCVTKKDAEKAEGAVIQAKYNIHYGFTQETVTFDEFVGTYERFVEQRNVNKTAKRLYVRLLGRFFRGVRLGEITPQQCRDCQKWVKSQGSRGDMSDSSVNRVMSTLSKMLNLACEEGILEKNPMAHVKALKEPPARRRTMTGEEYDRLWKELDKDRFLWRIVTLAVNLPVRKGQILALKASDVDLKSNLVYVIGSKNQPPRPVPLNRTARAVLAELVEERDSDWLFTYPKDSARYAERKGKPIGDFKRRWNGVLTRAGLKDLRFHDLRRQQATELLRKGVPLDVVQELFAHSSADITRVYAMTGIEQMREAVGRLDEMIESEVEQ